MSKTALPRFDFRPTSSPTPVAEREALLVDPGFARVFTDHMASLRWVEGKGWSQGVVEARRPLALDPATAVLHMSQTIFEGLKAYRSELGAVNLFRPLDNAKRFARSAQRLAMPALPEDLFLEAIERLVATDLDWVPRGESSLYLRPFMFASETVLHVRPAREYQFLVIASPVGPYFKGGSKPIKVWASRDLVRASVGGTGEAKCGGNYAASLLAQTKAVSQGCDQVVFLDAQEHRWVEELGGMNIFFVFDNGVLLTPPLGGTILPGVTRASVIDLARDRGLEVREAPYAIDEWRQDASSGHLREVFACGTAAVLTSIGTVKTDSDEFLVAGGREGALTRALRDHLVGIQRGVKPDTHGWLRRVDHPVASPSRT